jgi:membrane-bound serine protease (ClpP class)
VSRGWGESGTCVTRLHAARRSAASLAIGLERPGTPPGADRGLLRGSGRLARVGRLVFVVLAACCVGLGIGVSAGAAEASRAALHSRPVVYEVSIAGSVDPSVARLVERAVSDAERAHGAALVVRLDTPGGLDSSMRGIVKAIQASTVPVLCWTGPAGARAASAGTFILIGCPVAAMTAGTNVGAAHPVGVSGATETAKVTNDAVAYIRALAESRGRNADWGEQAVRESVSISAQAALGLHVIDLLASNVPALLDAVNGRRVETAAGMVVLNVAGATVHQVDQTAGERLIHWLSDADLAFLLYVLGLAGLVFEILHPGLNVPGLVGLVLFVLSLVLFDTLPINVAGAVFLAGAFVLFAIDLKVSAHGLPTLGGIVLFVLGGLLLYAPSSTRVSRPLLIGIAVALGGFFAVVVRAGLRARNAPVVTGVERLVGAEGLVIEALEPRGQVRVQAEVWTATLATGGAQLVPVGATVRVLAIRGLSLVVEPTSEASATGTASTGMGVRQ